MSALIEALQRISAWMEQRQAIFNGKKLSPLAPGLSYEKIEEKVNIYFSGYLEKYVSYTNDITAIIVIT